MVSCQELGIRTLTAVCSDEEAAVVTSYDRIDWHVDSAIEAGQPEEQAFTHIGLYLAWLIRRDLHDPRMFPAEHVDAVKAGDMTGSDLADDIDGKLISADMNVEGAAFSDARYDAYVHEYSALFSEFTEYSVEDGPEAYAKVERLLDRMYAEWVAGGRQAPAARPHAGHIDDDFPPTEQVLIVPPGFTQEQLVELLADVPGHVTVLPRDAITKAHAATELEALIPADMTSPSMEIESVRANRWGSSLLTRALKRLGIVPKDAVVAHGLGGDGEATLTVSIYRVPGIDEGRLALEFRSVIFRLPGSQWETRAIAGREVQWASGEEFTVAFWARDGMVIHVAGQQEMVVAAISRLP
jgi:hypothetical protein